MFGIVSRLSDTQNDDPLPASLSRRELLLSGALGLPGFFTRDPFLEFGLFPDKHFPAQKVDHFINKTMRIRHIPGAAVGVVREGNIICLKGFGRSDVEGRSSVDENTIFEIASLTKQFTAFAIMLLVKDGRLNLEDPISKHLKIPQGWEKVTIRHLLTHTSGIKDYAQLPEFSKTEDTREFSRQKVVSLISKQTLEFQPGERWAYSNSGYFLAGLIVEACSKKPYEEFLKERIFSPLGMEHTSLKDSSKDSVHKARGLDWKQNKFVSVESYNSQVTFAAGGLVSTVKDLILWQRALDSESLLSRAYLNQLWRRTRLNNGDVPSNVDFAVPDKLGYGLGWFLGRSPKSDSSSTDWISHYGLLHGFSSYILKIPHLSCSIVVLTNKHSFNEAGAFFSPVLLAEGIGDLMAPNLMPFRYPDSKDEPDSKSFTVFRRCLKNLNLGGFDHNDFSAESWQSFSSELPDYLSFFRTVGKPQKIIVCDERMEGDRRTSVYRVHFRECTWDFKLSVNPRGKILEFSALHQSIR